MRRISFVLAVAGAGLMLAGTSSRADTEETSTDADDKQEEQIRAKLQKAPVLQGNRIDVDVDDGIAVLEGTVDSAKEKKEAARLAHVDGILGVNNRLAVQSAGK